MYIYIYNRLLGGLAPSACLSLLFPDNPLHPANKTELQTNNPKTLKP